MYWRVCQVVLSLILWSTASSGESCTFREYGDVRLINGANPREGRVEVCIDETWGRVAGSFWGITDANVVCRQLGFGEHNIDDPRQCTNPGGSEDCFGKGTGLVHRSGVQCKGRESRLTDCMADQVPDQNSAVPDAGVTCLQEPSNLPQNVTVSTTARDIVVSWSTGGQALIRYDISCDMGDYVELKSSVNNTTQSLVFQRYGEEDTHRCCVSSVYTIRQLLYESKACATSNNSVAVLGVSTTDTHTMATGTTDTHTMATGTMDTHTMATGGEELVTCNADVVGGVLGLIIICLIVALVLCLLALAYPRYIRPRLEQGDHMSSVREAVDRTLHNPTYSPAAGQAQSQQLQDAGSTLSSQRGNSLGHHYEAVDSATVLRERREAADHVNTRRNMAYSDVHHQYDVISRTSSEQPSTATPPPHENRDNDAADTEIDSSRYEVSEAYKMDHQKGPSGDEPASRLKLDEAGYAHLEHN